ncbi:hypothetical protein AD006_03260 [Pseudonocardia sp. EC080610-09]|uniref:hypothetical protein n=1 Tax=unclassified Pseudonocardia TaxID=2619320 RepID=UPI0006CB1602|nr:MULTISPECIES: hypothetical protein [unclassified Pseudonocardia]ALE75216.1 hypothetical protein FRP1_24065 [Pseudonocardia sp. EC080625-04]ALL74581.1 hypothetical protein AD006_03260 [Pseudonocardia sp. EC080610-09]ALL81601.1 hypothetical protein AD017_11075 [Pseudonocardia sp. EC080619-01]
MDGDEARAALTEVSRRRGQGTRIALWSGTPRWFFVLAAVVLFGQMLVTDLRALDPAPAGWFLRWGVPLSVLVVLAVAGWVAHRRARATAHRSTLGEQLSIVAVCFVVFYGLLMGIGIPMRFFDVPFDQTVSGTGAMLLMVLGGFLWSRRRDRRG